MKLDRPGLAQATAADGVRARGSATDRGDTHDFRADLARAAGHHGRRDEAGRASAGAAERTARPGRDGHAPRVERPDRVQRPGQTAVRDATQVPARESRGGRDARMQGPRGGGVGNTPDRVATPAAARRNTDAVAPSTDASRQASHRTMPSAPQETLRKAPSAADGAEPRSTVESEVSAEDPAPADVIALPGAMLALLAGDLQPSVSTPPPPGGSPGASGPHLTAGALALGAASGTALAAPADAGAGAALPGSATVATSAAAGAAVPGALTTSIAMTGADAASGALATLAALAAASAEPATRAGTGADPFAAMLSAQETMETLSTEASSPFEGSSLVAPGGRVGETLATSRATMVLPPVPMPAVPEDGFDDGFGDRVVWMVEQKMGRAELRVSPDGVGAIDIRLQIEGQRVSAHFGAANADVRQALESGMDRLRDLLGQHGMELAHSEVGGQRQPGGRPPGAMPADADGDETGTAAPVTTIRALRARGLVDEYA